MASVVGCPPPLALPALPKAVVAPNCLVSRSNKPKPTGSSLQLAGSVSSSTTRPPSSRPLRQPARLTRAQRSSMLESPPANALHPPRSEASPPQQDPDDFYDIRPGLDASPYVSPRSNLARSLTGALSFASHSMVESGPGQSVPPDLTDPASSLTFDPNAIYLSGAHAASASLGPSVNPFWPVAPQIPFSSAGSATSLKTVAQYGQYTPPDDGSSATAAANPPASSKRSSLASAIAVDDDDLLMDSDYEEGSIQVSPHSLQQQEDGNKKAHTRKRKRKSATAASPEEDHKREEFLARNRVAASKSRQKKKEWTQALEEQLKNLQAENTHLTFTVNCLRDEVISMKTLCLAHTDCGCVKIRDYMNRSLDMQGPRPSLSVFSPQLPSQPPPPPHPHMIVHTAANFSRKPSDSSTSRIQAPAQSPAQERHGGSQAIDLTAEESGARSNVGAPNPSSSIHQRGNSWDMGQDGRPYLRNDSFVSPTQKASSDALPSDGRDANLSLMWNQSVNDGDYIPDTMGE